MEDLASHSLYFSNRISSVTSMQKSNPVIATHLVSTIGPSSCKQSALTEITSSVTEFRASVGMES